MLPARCAVAICAAVGFRTRLVSAAATLLESAGAQLPPVLHLQEARARARAARDTTKIV